MKIRRAFSIRIKFTEKKDKIVTQGSKQWSQTFWKINKQEALVSQQGKGRVKCRALPVVLSMKRKKIASGHPQVHA